MQRSAPLVFVPIIADFSAIGQSRYPNCLFTFSYTTVSGDRNFLCFS